MRRRNVALLAAALRAEYTAVSAAVAPLREPDFRRPTPCRGWNVRDLLVHLSRDARRACIALATPVRAEPDVDAVSYWRTVTGGAASPAGPASGAEARAVWEALAEIAVLAAEGADPEARVARQGHVLTVPDFLATLVTEATVHGLDLADALGRRPWPSAAGLEVTRATLAGLLGGAPPAALGWDTLMFVRKATGRSPLTDGEQASLPALPVLR